MPYLARLRQKSFVRFRKKSVILKNTWKKEKFKLAKNCSISLDSSEEC